MFILSLSVLLLCRKRPLYPIHRTRCISGICAIVVCCIGIKRCEVADKAPRAAAVGGTHAADGGIGGGAVAYAALDDSISAVGGDISTTDGAIGGDAGGGSGGDRR